MKISIEQLKYQQLDSRYWQLWESERKSRTDGSSLVQGYFWTSGIISNRFGLTYIIKELSKCFLRAIPVSLIFHDWRDKGLKHAKLYRPPQGVKEYPIVKGPGSTIIHRVCLTNEIDLIVGESRIKFHAELSGRHSKQWKNTNSIYHRNLIRLLDETLRSIFLTKKQKNETMIAPL